MVLTAVMSAISAFTAYAPPRFRHAASFYIKTVALLSSLLLLPWLLLGLDPACQVYGGLLVRIGTAGVLHYLNANKSKAATC
jgi:hypothetical protein